MCYNLYKAFEEEKEEKYYFKSHELLRSLSSDLKENYKVMIFIVMINYSIRKLNEGELHYKHELFDLYNEKLDQNLISDLRNNVYIFNHFRDYVYIGLAKRKYKWVEDFILKYSNELPFEIRESETKLSYAKLFFEKRNYKRSLEYLNELEASHYLMYMDISLYKICNYYELKEYEEAYLEIDKQKNYIRNHKEIPDIQKETNSNFMNIFKKLVRIKTEPDTTDAGFLEKELNKIKHISRRNWLLEKISQMNP